ncbi:MULTISPECIES: LLM class flavin-dependent oxidoreductase [Thermomonosporaceae]|uniref:LLM class flavin-dependent oxidoreductase n=1 Tax=Thermomonosporaceae TaxID=2012 RepID=UPI00255B3141|nr:MULTISPECIES: LLM class flavin-dependent oxidoreductase [Thermomonosporaceae]MDL4772517.1 LLM class flavin-dependent oxidoreductase [Actinomadura xylanilytica]
MRITYGPWGETLDELVAAGRAAEDAGAEALWLPELHRSATISAAAVAAGTSRAQVGTAIALAFTRSPMTTALEALDLAELSGGRFVLGLGTGVKRLNQDWHGVHWERPVARLRETVRIIRHFAANAGSGEPMVVEGELESLRVRGYQRPFPAVPFPIYLAGMGPVMTELAGEIADGWISHELCSPAWLRERALPLLRPGVDAVVSAACSIDDDPAAARGRAAGLAGFYASVRTYADFFAFHDLSAEQDTVIEAFRAGTGADHLAAAVPDRMVDALTLTGTAAQVAERVAGYAGHATTIKLTPPTHGLAPGEIRIAQRRIIDLIKELT